MNFTKKPIICSQCIAPLTQSGGLFFCEDCDLKYSITSMNINKTEGYVYFANPVKKENAGD